MSRPPLALSLLLAPLLGGCGVVSGVRTAFEMPTPAPPAPRELARARAVQGSTSLSGALSKLSLAQIGAWLSGDKRAPLPPRRAVLQPAKWSTDPARALAAGVQSGLIPSPPQLTPLPNWLPEPFTGSRRPTARPGGALILPARRVSGVTLLPSGADERAARAFFRGWQARESLRRADEGLLERRALQDRVALLARTAPPTVPLSGVSPATQLELSNLRLQLLPLLAATPARRAGAQSEIARIEARLREIWSAETARQNALLFQSTVEMPAQVRQEGEVALLQIARADAERTGARLAGVQRNLAGFLRASTTSRPPVAPAIFQPPTEVPDVAALAREMMTEGGDVKRGAVWPLFALPPNTLARRGQIPSNGAALTASEHEASVWRLAVR